MIHPDNSFDVSVDYKIVNKGTLLEDFSPPVNPPTEIDDPEDRKPDDWDEREKVADPDAKKPEDWDEDEPEQVPDADATKPDGWLDDEPEMIPDPSAEKPEDWDEDMDGTWEAPLINNPSCESAPGCGLWKAPMKANPKFKGKWRAAMIDNPNYRGRWRPRRIPNPDFFEDKHPFNMGSIVSVNLPLLVSLFYYRKCLIYARCLLRVRLDSKFGQCLITFSSTTSLLPTTKQSQSNGPPKHLISKGISSTETR